MLVAPSTTWLLVRISPVEVRMIPVPAASPDPVVVWNTVLISTTAGSPAVAPVCAWTPPPARGGAVHAHKEGPRHAEQGDGEPGGHHSRSQLVMSLAGRRGPTGKRIRRVRWWVVRGYEPAVRTDGFACETVDI